MVPARAVKSQRVSNQTPGLCNSTPFQVSQPRLAGAAWKATSRCRCQPCAAAFGGAVAQPATNRSVILEFLVEDVDKEFTRVKEALGEFVQEPTAMPWGNRSFLFRDPDGNLVNYFTPVTPKAIKKFKG